MRSNMAGSSKNNRCVSTDEKTKIFSSVDTKGFRPSHPGYVLVKNITSFLYHCAYVPHCCLHQVMMTVSFIFLYLIQKPKKGFHTVVELDSK